MTKHITVLLDQAVEGLITEPNGFYIDGTFGRGGHSRLVLAGLGEQGRLLGVDKDPEAVVVADALQAEDGRFEIEHGSFADMDAFARERGLEGKVDGILVDLGVSSPQLDVAERGFSFMNDGPLDMRMNTAAGQSAAEWVSSAGEEEMVRVFKVYGEEKFGTRMARAIIAYRAEQPITRTVQLANILAEANPVWPKRKHPATKAFQAIRIHVNNELGDLELMLDRALEILKPGGRLVCISFHSLEDRMVKRFIRQHEKGMDLPKGLPVTDAQLNKRLKSIGKAVKAEAGEVGENVRSRSAVMRIAEKLK